MMRALPQPLSIPRALRALPAIEEVLAEDAEDESVYELAAGRKSTPTLSPGASNESNSSTQDINETTEREEPRMENLNVLIEEAHRHSNENERQLIRN